MSTDASPIQVAAGISGGVDSAVAAWLLLEQGHQVSGVFMQNWEEDDNDYCTAVEDYRDAAGVCDQLGISLSAVNFSAEYWDRVFAGFLDEYNAGRTPNPDILCNSEIKFRAFLDHALNNGAQKIATGHYARTDLAEDGQHRLLRGADESKDQSYFLHLLNQEQLSRAIFPVGSLIKSDLRAIAQQLNLQVHSKRDSTGICFIGERRFRDFLAEFVSRRPGPIKSMQGDILAEHTGLAFYTIGQRQGLGIGGHARYDDTPWYVARKDMTDNTLIVVQGHDHPALHARCLTASHLHWIRSRPHGDLHCTAKVRYRQKDTECVVKACDDNRAIVEFSASVRAITPGQSVVFYNGDECLGGGIIESAYQPQTATVNG
jgi:tRNA-specific 2-thiouridylase